MNNIIVKHIPNTITSMNLLCGVLGVIASLNGRLELGFELMILAAVFDFCDGLAARLLKAYSEIGKELDSLADDVSFGVAPSRIVYSLFKEMHYRASMEFIAPYMPYTAFLISVFSALRLAKFNNDTRQTSSFIGVPVPANALFFFLLVAGIHPILISESFNPLYLLALVCLFSWLLVSEIPMFSLKFKSLSWKDNKVSFSFLIICIPLLVFLKVSGFAAVIVWYILLSLLTGKRK